MAKNSSLKSFSISMKGLTNKTRAAAQSVLVNRSLAVHQALVLATPVDTGYTRSNWLVSVGEQPFRGRIRPYAPGYKLGIDETQNAAGAINQGIKRLSRISILQKYQDVFIGNNVEYLTKINSEQAPRNFIRVAIKLGLSDKRPYKKFVQDINKKVVFGINKASFVKRATTFDIPF